MHDGSKLDARPTRGAWRTLALGIGVALAATIGAAQPTGNPKGTKAPAAEGQSGKMPATRKPAGQHESNAVATGPASQAASRERTPGGGITGGLTGRHPPGESPDPKQNATPLSVPQKK